MTDSALSMVSLGAARRLRADRLFHQSPGAQPINTEIVLILEGAEANAEVMLTDVRREISWQIAMHKDENGILQARVLLPSRPTMVRYHFVLPETTFKERIQFEGRNAPQYGEWIEREFQIAVYDPAQMPAPWTRGQVIYQIFPDRFAKSREYQGIKPGKTMLEWGAKPEHPPRGRDFFGGNLLGLIEKLDYLHDLGVECIYLTPIFTSPSNHRYDAVNYHQIDPLLGTEEQFATLVEKVHAFGMRIILDAVFNHCSDSSIYFKGAKSSRESPYYSWFVFKHWPDDYEGWVGHRHMPEFAESPDAEQFFLGPRGVAAHWLNYKIDGYRTDVTRWVTDEFWRRFRTAVHAINPEAYLVAEEWEDSSHYLLGDMYDATMNYRFAWTLVGFFADDKLTASQFDDRLQVWMRDTPPPALLSQMNLVDSHDTWRILTICNGDKRKVKQMAAFQFAYPGSPMIYYGDEAGLEGDYAESARRAFPWQHIDIDLHGFYKHALAGRRELRALRLGSVQTVLLDDQHRLYAFVRRFEGESVYAIFNTGDSLATAHIPMELGESGHWKDVLGDHPSIDVQGEMLIIEIAPRGAAWYIRG